MPVIASAMRAPARASARWCQKPISKKDEMAVSSQNTTSNSRLPARVMPSIAPMNRASMAKKVAGGSSSARYQRA